MKNCIIKEAWKDLKVVATTATVILAFIAIITLLLTGIGYISAQWFDLCLSVAGSSPMIYYVNNGGALVLATVFILLIVAFPFMILWTIIDWIKNLRNRCR